MQLLRLTAKQKVWEGLRPGLAPLRDASGGAIRWLSDKKEGGGVSAEQQHKILEGAMNKLSAEERFGIIRFFSRNLTSSRMSSTLVARICLQRKGGAGRAL